MGNPDGVERGFDQLDPRRLKATKLFDRGVHHGEVVRWTPDLWTTERRNQVRAGGKTRIERLQAMAEIADSGGTKGVAICPNQYSRRLQAAI